MPKPKRGPGRPKGSKNKPKVKPARMMSPADATEAILQKFNVPLRDAIREAIESRDQQWIESLNTTGEKLAASVGKPKSWNRLAMIID